MARAQALIKVQSILLVVVGAWYFGVGGFIWGTIISSVLALIPLLRQVGFGFIKTSLDKAPANFMRYSLFSAMANGVAILGQRGDIFILDYFVMDRAAIGYYSLGLIFASAGLQVTGTVQAITTSYFSERAEESSWFRKQLVRNQINLALLSVGVAIAIFAAASLLVPFVYGPEYLPALSFLAILLLGYVIRSSHSLIGVGLFSLGLMHYNFVIAMITTTFSLGLSYMLLQRLGMVGVAWGQVGASALSLVIMVVVISRVFSSRAQKHE
jgi:O-antigen/teichoic acid export membrane protein